MNSTRQKRDRLERALGVDHLTFMFENARGGGGGGGGGDGRFEEKLLQSIYYKKAIQHEWP